MANPQPTDAHIRIAHSIQEQLMVSDFTEQQRRILDLILRLSWGCGKKYAIIPHQNTFEIVGVGETHIKDHLNWLIQSKVIIRNDTEYSFNKDFDQWRVSRALKYTPEILTELVSLNIKGNNKLTENGSLNLRKTEECTYGKRKNVTPELATPKEILNKDINNNTYKNNNNGNKKIVEDDPDKFVRGKYGHMVQR